ncbi:DUF444 family protein [Halarchaeum sp. P4]|uniref:DUF444 family protein n=1 Tax=Halarchaeum sp. P4 TaxID=3421639 RepID=UPI003EBA59F8
MGLRDDLERYREVGEEAREDLAEFVQYGDLGASRPDSVSIPVKLVDLPEFAYDRRDMGGVGQAEGGQPQPGQPVGEPQPGEGDGDGDEAGDGHADHEYYEMDPEEFAEALDDELGLDLDPKGKTVRERTTGDFNDVARNGPKGTLDFERLFKQGLKRTLATDFDEEYVMEALRVAGWDVDDVFRWARGQSIPVSRAWLDARADGLDDAERWDSIEAMEAECEMESTAARVRREGVQDVAFRRDDERYRHPEVVEEQQKSVVVVNIRDVSGSMREEKRDLVERTLTPLDWYLTGKYDEAVFLYVAHDADAWEVERAEFFGLQSGGGTRISSGYELAADLLEEYPFDEWNRYVFAAGDGENSHNDSEERVVPLMADIDANLHAYVEVQPGTTGRSHHGDVVQDAFEESEDVAVARVHDNDDVLDAIETILTTETGDEE